MSSDGAVGAGALSAPLLQSKASGVDLKIVARSSHECRLPGKFLVKCEVCLQVRVSIRTRLCDHGWTQPQDGWGGPWGWARPGHQPMGPQCS